MSLTLAIANSPAQALGALVDIEPLMDGSDDEVVARFFQARAIAKIKAREVGQGFDDFDRAVAAARKHGEPLMLGKVLNNYAAAAMNDGSIAAAIQFTEEALEKFRSCGSSTSFALVTLAEVSYEAGDFRRAADALREFHAIQRSDSSTAQYTVHEHFMSVAAVGIPLGIMLSDDILLGLSSDTTLLDLAFSQQEQSLLGPLAEAFCALFEYKSRREEHDALLERAIDASRSLDHSMQLGIRAARVGDARHLPRISMLVARQAGAHTRLSQAYKDLFDSFLARRRQSAERCRQLAAHAAMDFEEMGRPVMQSIALEASGNLDKAMEIRHRCGSRIDALRQRWEGIAIDKRLATDLTPREAEVAKLASQGSANRAIAASLGVSERTVHRHCEAIFGKLGIRSRWQLAAAIGSPEET
ncbi:MAG TPA: helix-turn-helix transcriptional regulator [Candidatus Cybelea sp.]|nr:helix-turn-helix transcriptional regulator [Candidatus Cybelea sp.]